MSYADQAALAADGEFNQRLTSALTTEGRADIADPLAKLVMNSPMQGAAVFMPFVSSAPGFADMYGAGGQASITDNDILAAVQASWNDVAVVQGLIQ
jgi:hypothetical protein